jgi:tetratricopeptide (TPR) repeat protein
MGRLLRCILLLLTTVTVQTLYAAPVMDSIAIPDARDTTAYITYLNKLSAALTGKGESEQAVQYANHALELARLSDYDEGEAIALFNIGNAYSGKGENKKALSSFIKSLKRKKDAQNLQRSEKLYYNMAVVLARIKKYPQALKYFHKASLAKEKQDESPDDEDVAIEEEDTEDDAALPLEPGQLLNSDTLNRFRLYDGPLHITQNELVVDKDTILLNNDYPHSRKAAKLLAKDITQPFYDHKKALAYGLLIHTKQPVSGKRKSFTGINNVGHMFITLIKFNRDSGYVSRTFGFYPEKDNLLSATPLIPTATSVFKDDELHDWDEMVGKFISRHRFRKILRMVKQYSRSKYNLNKNNCTDFGLCVAAIAGIKIDDTRGSWPLGSGNNPASAGQSILEGKVEDTDEGRDLLILNNLFQ